MFLLNVSGLVKEPCARRNEIYNLKSHYTKSVYVLSSCNCQGLQYVSMKYKLVLISHMLIQSDSRNTNEEKYIITIP